MENKSLLKNAIFNVLYKLLNVIFPLISYAYISRVLLPEKLGSVAYAQNIVSYFIIIASLGIPSYGIREIARKRTNKNELNKIFSELFFFNLISTTICIIMYYVFIISNIKSSSERILFILCGIQLLFNYINIDWFYQGNEEYVYIAIRSSIIKFVSILSLFVFVKNTSDYLIYAFISSLAIGGNYIFNVINLRGKVKLVLKNINLIKHLKPILILVISSVAIELYSKIDITMLGTMVSKEEVAFYSNSQKLITSVLTFITAISGILLPRLSFYYIHERERFNNLINVGFNIVILITLPSCLGLILTSKELVIFLFGNSYLNSVAPLKILSILLIVKSVGDILCYQVIISSGHENKLVPAYLSGVIVNITLNLILISKFQSSGAAIASMLSEIVVNCILLVYTKSIFKLYLNNKDIFKVFVSLILMCIGIYLFKLVPIESNTLKLCFEISIGVIIYFGCNIILKNNLLSSTIRELKRKSDK